MDFTAREMRWSAHGSKRRRLTGITANSIRSMAYKRMSSVGYEVVTYRGLAKTLKQNYIYLNGNPPNIAAMRHR